MFSLKYCLKKHQSEITVLAENSTKIQNLSSLGWRQAGLQSNLFNSDTICPVLQIIPGHVLLSSLG